jgi:hypothetical protein
MEKKLHNTQIMKKTPRQGDIGVGANKIDWKTNLNKIASNRFRYPGMIILEELIRVELAFIIQKVQK